MPTALSWAEVRRAVADVRHLLWFRARTVRRPAVAVIAVVVLAAVAVATATVPAWVPVDAGVRADLRRLLPAMLAAVAFVSIASAVAGAGGRELLGRDPASIHPVSPVTDHLGALALAPLNLGWLVQAWTLLGLAAVVSGPEELLPTQLVVLSWVLATTALGQAVAWGAEWVRRGPRGLLAVRLLLGAVLAAGALAGGVPDLRGTLVAGPAQWTADVLRDGAPTARAVAAAGLLAVTAAVVALGAALASLAARRSPRDEARLETRSHPARPTPRSGLAMMRRLDRASVWRSVPLRRGTYLLALAPGAIALAGGLDWSALLLMPGLVASGCVLLFGVNVWCLDGRGLLWRETLPVSPSTVLLARAWVLTELLLGAGAATLVLGAVRAGAPTRAELVGVVVALLVVVGQSVSGGLRWSHAHPYAVDLRSARATPAPPLAMVGYSVRLALTTTLTALVVTGLVEVGRVDLLLATGALLLAVSAARLALVHRRWVDPVRRSRVVGAVSA